MIQIKKAAKMPLKDLSIKIGRHPCFLSKVNNGKAHLTVSDLKKIAEIIGGKVILKIDKGEIII